MKTLKMYCFSLSNSNLDKIKKINYIPVGLGKENFNKEWIRDNTKENISTKNSWYGENTFYYWLWKNNFKKNFDTDWVGFCHYRRFWLKDNKDKEYVDFKQSIVQDVPDEWNNYEVVLGDEMSVNNYKLIKVLKHAKLKFLMNPQLLFKKNRNIKLHFDIFHGEGLLEKAIRQLDKKDQEGFEEFVMTKTSFNRENMFFCRSKKLLDEYYKCIFRWLGKCEDIFGFNLDGYAKKRIYAFLAERFVSYWFQKNSNYINWPIFFYDTNANKLILK